MPLRARSLRVVLTGLALGLAAACSSGPAQFGGARPTQSEIAVYEAVARWIHQYYDPSDVNGMPAAFCLATGRRAFTATDRYRRGPEERWIPEQGLLDRLNDLEPPVVRVSECWRSDETQEELGRGGPPAALLLMEQPNWTSATTARIEMRTRENNSYQYAYLCRVELRNGVWRVLDCI